MYQNYYNQNTFSKSKIKKRKKNNLQLHIYDLPLPTIYIVHVSPHTFSYSNIIEKFFI